MVGDGTTTGRKALPVFVSTLGIQAAGLAVGGSHSCARKADGTLWCWGNNQYGQLGNTALLVQYWPSGVIGLGTEVADFALGGTHSCARKTDGTLWCWGETDRGAIGDGTTSGDCGLAARCNPVQVSALGNEVGRFALGGTHTCAVKTDGTLWCWGNNQYGQLGDGTSSHGMICGSAPTNYDCSPTPVQVTALSTDVSDVVLGASHTCAIKTDGTLWCWGRSEYGQLGGAASDACVSNGSCTPAQVTALSTEVAAGDGGTSHTCAIKTDGKLWCWGDDMYGKIGDGTTYAALAPTRVVTCGDGICEFIEKALGTCADDCTAPCGDGICDPFVENCQVCSADCACSADGDSCTAGAQCTSGFCVDGVCCDSACGGGLTGDCQACSIAAGASVNGVCETRPPDCAGKQCGDDGCGGSRGTCGALGECNALQQCECVPQCDGEQCGDDGCGGSCGSCGAGETCNALQQCEAACGDAICASSEDCNSCAADCGACSTEASWAPQSSGMTGILRAVAFPTNVDLGYAVGDGGVILKTTDGGANWASQTSGTTAMLRGVAFVDTTTGAAVGDGGVIVKTTDGASFAVLTLGTTETLRGVGFVSATAGFVVGDGGTILATSDGNSFSPLTSGVAARLHAVAFPMDTLPGAAVGDGGVVLRTDDGGSNWVPENAATSENLRTVDFPAYWANGVVAGEGGTVIGRHPAWDATVLYETAVASLAPPTIMPSADAALDLCGQQQRLCVRVAGWGSGGALRADPAGRSDTEPQPAGAIGQ